jgi:23S rRNA (guanine745-N1)-methyltransferase
LPIVQIVDLLRCPHCTSKLSISDDGRATRCDQGHRFDLAKQGYLNLTAGPQPANADTPAMVASRDRFLGTGIFDSITAAACRLAAPSSTSRILDAGAGTGRLLAALLEAGGSRDPDVSGTEPILPRGIALDVSTAAGRRSARAHPRLGAVVADVWQRLPVADASVDLVVSNFAPRNPAEFARVLESGGRLLTITPTPDHLAELRRTYGLLEIQPDKSDRLAASLAGRFEPVAADRIHSRARWSADVVADAMAMGPNAFHRRSARPPAQPTDVTVSVELRVWRRP